MRVRLHQSLYPWVMEQEGTTILKRTRAGLEVDYEISGLEWFLRKVLGYGTYATVLGPEKALARYRELLQKTLAQYR